MADHDLSVSALLTFPWQFSAKYLNNRYVLQCSHVSCLLCLRYHREVGIIKWAVVCLSVCLSFCRMPRPNSRAERPRKPKISRMEVHHMSNPWTYLEVKRSMVKVTRPIKNAHTVHAQCLPNFKLGSNTDEARRVDPYHRQAPWPPRSRSQGHVVSLTGVGP